MTPLRARRGAAEGGFKLVEVVVSVAILSGVVMALTAAVSQMQGAASYFTTEGATQGGIYSAGSFMAGRLRQSGTRSAAGVVLSSPASGGRGYWRVQFNEATGIDAATGAVTWTARPRAVGFAFERGEATGGTAIAVGGVQVASLGATGDGADNDGDGLVDEGILYYETYDAANNKVWLVLARDVLKTSYFAMATSATATVPDTTADAVLMHLESAHRAPDAKTGRNYDQDPTQFVTSRLDWRANLMNAGP